MAVVVLLLIASTWPPRPAAAAAAGLEVRFLDAGQGDAAVYMGPCGEVGIVDVLAGGADEVLAALGELGTTQIEWMSVSHYDADHVGGVAEVGRAPGVTVGAVYDRGGDRDAKDTNTYRNYYDWVTTASTRVPVDIGDRFDLCSGEEAVTFTVVSAGTDGSAADGVAVSEENDRGLCLHVAYRSFDLASCGDVNGTDDGARTDVESAVADRYGDVEVAKISHHGSAFSSNATYVEQLRAEVAVAMVGDNSYGHPDPAVLDRWVGSGAEVFITGDGAGAVRDGTVLITTDGATFQAVGTASGRIAGQAATGAPAYELARRPSPFDDNPSTTERVGAPSAREQAATISRLRFADDGARHVVLSRDDVFADSLAGTSLLGDGPLLLVASNGLPAVTFTELARVLPEGGRVYLLGGERAITPVIEQQLVGEGYDVVRLAGPSRVETSVQVAREVRAINPAVADLVIARAYAPATNPTAAWADSVTVGGWAAAASAPVVITPTGSLHPAVAAFMGELAPDRTVLLGGAAALSAQVEQAVASPQRINGANRASTAVSIAEDLWPADPSRFVLINGYAEDAWAYGLPAAGLSADAQAPLLISTATQPPPETLQQLSAPCGGDASVELLVAGDSPQISDAVVAQLDQADGGPCPSQLPAPACDSSYPDFCVPPPPPDLDCGDLTERGFAVLSPDPHGFDGDGNGVGCES